MAIQPIHRALANSDGHSHVIDVPACLPKPVFMTASIRRHHRRIVFSIVLVTVQMASMSASAHGDHDDRSCARDLWVMPRSTKVSRIFLIDDRQRFRALAVDGVGGSRSSRHWLRAMGDWPRWTTPFSSLGSELRDWIASVGSVAGSVDDCRFPARWRCDQSYFERLAPAGWAQRRDSRSKGPGDGGDQGHPFIHHDAFRIHGD